MNHQISKKLVQKAKCTCQGIALEELTNFFDKKKVRKSERNQRHSWSFRQLRDFIQYKALLAGVKVILVNPAYTSQECSICGYVDKSNRKSQSDFHCQLCGFATNADYNASINISRKAVVNQPIVATPKESATNPIPCGWGN
jgi:IS605 OrfB family transposase